MTNASLAVRRPADWALIGYALICTLALAFDLLTDRSFGASMLAVLPISLIALICLLAGPWLPGIRKVMALRGWFIGMALIVLISSAFSLLGPEQAKTGATLFTYAALLMAFPGSIVLPFAAASFEPLLNGDPLAYYLLAWFVCGLVGWLEWKALCWLYAYVQRRKSRVRSPI